MKPEFRKFREDHEKVIEGEIRSQLGATGDLAQEAMVNGLYIAPPPHKWESYYPSGDGTARSRTQVNKARLQPGL